MDEGMKEERWGGGEMGGPEGKRTGGLDELVSGGGWLGSTASQRGTGDRMIGWGIR
jgi:hypothetical protein